MPRKPELPSGVLDVLEDLSMRLRAHPNASFDVKQSWYKEAVAHVGPRAAKIAYHIFEARTAVAGPMVTNNISTGAMNMSNTPAGQSINQTAGGDMTGVNAGGTQTAGDINVYKAGLASVPQQERDALTLVRQAIDDVHVEAIERQDMLDALEKLTSELKSGDAKNTKRANSLWSSFVGLVGALPAAAKVGEALINLGKSFGWTTSS